MIETSYLLQTFQIALITSLPNHIRITHPVNPHKIPSATKVVIMRISIFCPSFFKIHDCPILRRYHKIAQIPQFRCERVNYPIPPKIRKQRLCQNFLPIVPFIESLHCQPLKSKKKTKQAEYPIYTPRQQG